MRSATVTRPGPNQGLQVAVKCVQRTNLPREDEEDLLEEVGGGLRGKGRGVSGEGENRGGGMGGSTRFR